MPERIGGPSRARLIAAFAAVYVIWGSTYLAIKVAIASMPPFLMAGTRFLIAGALLYGWMRLRGAPRPSPAQWKVAAVVGGLLLLGGNGAVVWAEQTVPTGLAALIVSSVPFWLVMLEWARPGGERPGAAVIAGLVLGLAGIALLVGPGSVAGGGRVDLIGVAVLLAGSLSWAIGSLYSRRAPRSSPPLLVTAMQMLAGGAFLLVVGAIAGEPAAFELQQVTVASLLGLLYLIAFGSLIGYVAYIWLLGVTTPAKVGTYAYVNPVVAVLLGWLFLDEALTGRMLVAAAVIVGAVALITTAGSSRLPRPPRGAEARDETPPEPAPVPERSRTAA